MIGNEKTFITLRVNDENYDVAVKPSDKLIDVLRRELSLTGAKPSCLNGDCGACTVLVDDEVMKSCLMLAVEGVGHSITTIEGLKDNIVQDAFIKHLAFQCGYCTSGFIMNIVGMLKKIPTPSDEDVQEWMISNICRCTSYQEIRMAIDEVIKHSFNTNN